MANWKVGKTVMVMGIECFDENRKLKVYIRDRMTNIEAILIMENVSEGTQLYIEKKVNTENFIWTGLGSGNYMEFKGDTGITCVDETTWTHVENDSVLYLFSDRNDAISWQFNRLKMGYELIIDDILIEVYSKKDGYYSRITKVYVNGHSVINNKDVAV